MKCFACDKKFKNKKSIKWVDTRENQIVPVGPECFKKIGEDGYSPPLGGPKLYPLKKGLEIPYDYILKDNCQQFPGLEIEIKHPPCDLFYKGTRRKSSQFDPYCAIESHKINPCKKCGESPDLEYHYGGFIPGNTFFAIIHGEFEYCYKGKNVSELVDKWNNENPWENTNQKGDYFDNHT